MFTQTDVPYFLPSFLLPCLSGKMIRFAFTLYYVVTVINFRISTAIKFSIIKLHILTIAINPTTETFVIVYYVISHVVGRGLSF